MKHDRDKLVFETTGRTEYANCGFVGIDHELDLSSGYDQGFGPEDYQKEGSFTEEERNELADHIISLWEKWRAKGVTPPGWVE